MFNRIINKRSTILLEDGGIIEGVVSFVDDKYVEIIELDGCQLIVKKDLIDFVRVAHKEEVEKIPQIFMPSNYIPSKKKCDIEHNDDYLDSHEYSDLDREVCGSASWSNLNNDFTMVNYDNKNSTIKFERQTLRGGDDISKQSK